MELTKVGTQPIVLLAIGAALAFILPVAGAVIWKVKKKEPFTSILAGAATFLLFVIVLEKPIQNILLFPTQMGLPDHSVSSYVNARPVLLSLLAGLFPGVFEETGRLIAYKTVLRNRRHRETSVSHGIGHGGFEVMYILGATYIAYIAYAVMINSGTFGTIVDQVAARLPDQVEALYAQANEIGKFTAGTLFLNFIERIFAVLFHIGASILVFYAVKDRKKFWLYPLAVVLHTAMDSLAALYLFEVIRIPAWALETVIGVFGIAVFCGAYFLLYRKDGE
ncbi:MAG: YhfC family intramembrane metalloprotease [Lachnospiraceae bacterium]|nr:YhfC family intramembrane metalloprotease [Lachnospiraceae bacterium]